MSINASVLRFSCYRKIDKYIWFYVVFFDYETQKIFIGRVVSIL